MSTSGARVQPRSPTSITCSRSPRSRQRRRRVKPDLVIAAFLHDAIEDQEVPRDVIAEAFGEEVAKLVEEVTDDKNLKKQGVRVRMFEDVLAVAMPASAGLPLHPRRFLCGTGPRVSPITRI